MRYFHVQYLVLTIAALAGVASGQQKIGDAAADGPVVVGTPRESWKTFDLLKLDSSLEFRWMYQKDKLSGNNIATQNTTESRYRELLDLNTEFTLGHKNLVDVTAAFQLGREDIYLHDSNNPLSGHEKDTVNLYDVNALILGTSSLPTDIFARRTQSVLNRAFSSSIDETVTEHGFGTRYQTNGGSTASMRYLHREDVLTGDFGTIDTKVKQDTLALDSHLVLTSSNKLDFSYTFDKISESQAGGFSDAYNRNDVNIVDTYAFGGDEKPHELRSTFRLYEQGGKQEQSRAHWDELLTLRHTDRFETRYNLLMEELNVPGNDQHQVRGDASAKYRLFDSLTTTGTVGAQRFETGDGATNDDFFVNAHADYTKKVPYGQLDASAGLALDAQRNSERGQTFRVNNEAHTFVDGFPITLSRRNIVPGSIVITPVTGFPPYQEGLDYTTAVYVDYSEVRGIVGGSWVNGQTVLISYDVGPEAASDINTNTMIISVRYTFEEGGLKGLALYSTFRSLTHNVKSKDPVKFNLDDVNDLLLGVEYQIAEYDLKYEYNNYDSTFNPYTVHRVQGIYTLPLGPGSSFNADVTREIIDFSKENNRVVFDRASVRWDKRLNSAFNFNARLEYRNENSSQNGESRGIDEVLGLQWTKRQTTVYGSIRNSNLTGPGSKRSSQGLQFNIRRAF